jgi:replicative DNA helicase
MKKSPYGRNLNTAESLLASIKQEVPCDHEAERGVLSCIFQDQDKIERLNIGLDAFHYEPNRTILEEMLEMHAKQLAIDPIICTKRLRDKELLERIGGAQYLTEIYTFVPSPYNFQAYSDAVRDKYADRIAIQKCGLIINRIQNKIPDQSVSVEEILREAIDEIESHDIEDEDESVISLVGQAVEDLQYDIEHPNMIKGVTTGWERIDESTQGFMGSKLWIITGESGDGKSTLSRQMIESYLQAPCRHEGVDMPYGHKAIIYTYEMAPKKEIQRMICSVGSLDSSEMKRGKLSREDQKRFLAATKIIMGFDLVVKNVSGKSVQWIIKDIRRRRRKLRPGQRLVCEIDYVQLISTEEKGHERRQLEIASITKKLHDLCMTLDIDIILPSQVNEDGKAREARDIKNDCDVKIDIINKETEDKPRGGYQAYKSGGTQAEKDCGIRHRVLKCDKNRDGSPDWEIKVKLIGPQFRFAPDF